MFIPKDTVNKWAKQGIVEKKEKIEIQHHAFRELFWSVIIGSIICLFVWKVVLGQ